MRSSSGRNVAVSPAGPTGTNRGTLLGTLTRAKCGGAGRRGRAPMTARFSDSPLM